jgi:hypothetical protein
MTHARTHARTVALNMPTDPSQYASYGPVESEDDKVWSFAISRPSSTSGGGMRICHYMTGGNMGDNTYGEVRLMDCSGNTIPGTSAAVEDAWDPASTVMNGAYYEGGQTPQWTTIFKASTATSPAGIRILARERDFILPINYTESQVTTDINNAMDLVPWGFEAAHGNRIGVATYQFCDPAIGSICPSAPFTLPNTGVFGAWPDGRRKSTTKMDIYARSWRWQD